MLKYSFDPNKTNNKFVLPTVILLHFTVIPDHTQMVFAFSAFIKAGTHLNNFIFPMHLSSIEHAFLNIRSNRRILRTYLDSEMGKGDLKNVRFHK